MEIGMETMSEVAHAAFLEKLDSAFLRDLPRYKEIEEDDRVRFIAAAVELAEGKGFKTEQGIASYVLALWYLDADFEERSGELAALLDGDLPEVRKTHAMNRWVETLLGAPDDVAAADEAMKRALRLTEPWGKK